MYKKPTIKEIAAIAGVSHVSVSKALRGCSDISIETTNKIVKIANSLGYVPNAAARNLSVQKANSIGMIVPSLEEHTAYNTVFNQVSLTAAKHNFPVMLGISQRSIELEEKHCRLMCQHQVGAIIVATATSNTAHLEKACHNHIPLIYIGGKTGPEKTFSLFCNYEHSAKLVVDYLYNLGHRNIALLDYKPRNNTIIQKETGFKSEMIKYGLTPMIYTAGNADDTISAGNELALQILSQPNMPTALWCASDLLAVSVINTLKSNGVSIPDDISIVGHDDLSFSSLPGIDLTTVQTPLSTLGASAAELAIRLSTDESIPQHVETFLSKIVIRNTTGSRYSTNDKNE